MNHILKNITKEDFFNAVTKLTFREKRDKSFF